MRTKSDGFTGVFLDDFPSGNVCNITTYAPVMSPLFNQHWVFHRLPQYSGEFPGKSSGDYF